MADRKSLLHKLARPSWFASKTDRENYAIASGHEGERLTREILEHWETVYFSIEQNIDTLPKWISTIGGKRPDFIAFTNIPNEIILIDSKFYKNYNGYIYLDENEIKQYENLVARLKANGISAGVLFIFPIGGMAGHNFFAFSLAEVQSADGSPYKQLIANRSYKK